MRQIMELLEWELAWHTYIVYSLCTADTITMWAVDVTGR